MNRTEGIAAAGLAKCFGQVRAVESVTFSVQAGGLFGFLGPNGAGKTPTINMLTGLARPDAGTIRVGGIDCTRNPKAAQHLMGIVPDESNLCPELIGVEDLCFCGADVLHAGIRQRSAFPLWLDFSLLGTFCAALLAASLRNIRKKWIV